MTRRPRLAPSPCVSLLVLLFAPSFPFTILAAVPLGRTTIVVKADSRTGRLVRSAVVAPAILAAPETSATGKPMSENEIEAVASGSMTEMIDAIAERNQVEAPLVHSVIRAESNYNPGAISPKGAQGLMQLIPSTARRFGVANSFNVQQNVEGGVKYLKFLIGLYGNDYVKVIAAYNAGEGAVAKYGGIPPYAETIQYVARVGKNLKIARQVAELRASQRKAVHALTQTADAKPVDTPRIHAITGDDGRVYYRTQ